MDKNKINQNLITGRNLSREYFQSCCYSSQSSYGVGYQPITPNIREKFTQKKNKNGDDGYSSQSDYGMKFGRDYENSWTCPTPIGCVKKRTDAMDGII